MAKHENIFVISDLHFGHENIWKKFKMPDEVTALRPFTSTVEMNETMIDNWNSVVGPKDLVLVLGDVAFSGVVYDEVMPQLAGDKYLIRGNHDTLSETRYRCHFKRILGSYDRHNFIYTHIPVHAQEVDRFEGNIHGHLHASIVRDSHGYPDIRYFNASVERIGFTPMHIDTIMLVMMKDV